MEICASYYHVCYFSQMDYYFVLFPSILLKENECSHCKERQAETCRIYSPRRSEMPLKSGCTYRDVLYTQTCSFIPFLHLCFPLHFILWSEMPHSQSVLSAGAPFPVLCLKGAASPASLLVFSDLWSHCVDAALLPSCYVCVCVWDYFYHKCIWELCVYQSLSLTVSYIQVWIALVCVQRWSLCVCLQNGVCLNMSSYSQHCR